MEKETESLSAEEKAYFDTRGESEVTADPPEASKEEAGDEPAVELVEAPEEQSEGSAEKEDGKRKVVVPLRALTESRGETRTEREKRVAAEQRAAILEDRWNQMFAAQQKQEQEPAVPDQSDPLARLNWAANTVQSIVEKQTADEKARTEQEHASREWKQTVDKVTAEYNEAVAEDAEIATAYDALRKSQGMEFLAMGLSQQEALAELQRLEADHIAYAASKGINIGRYLTSLAEARGWKRAEKKADSGADLEKLAEAVEGSTTLSGAGGGAPKVTDAEAVANMKPDEFEAWLSKNGTAKFRKLAGG